jgi:acylphosphatase
MASYELFVSGTVQGVYYRASTVARARELELTGFVENLPDGRVHAIIQGAEENCQALIEWCKQGPPRARVSGVDVSSVAEQSFHSFQIQYSVT